MLYDITPAIDEALPVWPGDTPPTREILADMQRGDNVTLSTLRATVHLGAHADAPSHYAVDGATIDRCNLETYLGRCQVVRVAVPPATSVTPALLGVDIEAERVLIATGTGPDRTTFTKDFAGLSPELVDFLRGQGVRLVGIDTPSVDVYASEDLPVHKRFAANEMAIIEGLALHDVPAGAYELIALPLKLVGFDASPIRAVLRTE